MMDIIKRTHLSIWMAGFLMLLIPSTHYAKTLEVLKEPLIPAQAASPWTFEFGPRYWYSSARYKENLLGGPTILVSRLTYEDLTANSAEGFGRLQHQNGVYLKGYIGGGSIGGGQLVDEDFPPGITYSRTISPQKNGSLHYLSIDLGYNFMTRPNWRLGGFIGYHYWQEFVTNFGCTQTAGGTVCATPIALSVDSLNNSAAWSSLRLGLNEDMDLAKDWHLETDLAYIQTSLQETDFHNLRPSIRGLLDTGTGNGFQLDVLLKWLLSDEFSVGVGGRWWYLVTHGWAHFEQIVTPGQPQPIDGIQSRYGLLLQADYQFSDTPHALHYANEFTWNGTYLGANIGYGTNPSMLDITATSDLALTLQVNSAAPISLNLQNAGFLGGGQLGYNWQNQHIVWGAEGDLEYAHIGGANAVTSLLPLTTTVNQNIRWLGSIRGRIGTLASENMLVYVTTGPVWGGITLAFDQRNLTASCASSPVCVSTTQHSTELGWTIGGGIEYAVASRMSLKAEYAYVDLGVVGLNAAETSALGEAGYFISTHFSVNTVRLGMNYKMDDA